MRRASLLLACLFALLAFSAPARAQQTTGTIAGRLTMRRARPCRA